MRCLFNFFAVLRCSGPPKVPLQYLIYPEIFARTTAAILDCPEIFAGRMAAILDLRVHDSNESPTNAPHSCGQEPQNARIPHLLGTQRAANKVINPHQSPTYPGVGGGSGFTLTGALANQLCGMLLNFD